jgi:hypothetical protein
MSIKNVQTLYKSILMELDDNSTTTTTTTNSTKDILSKTTELRITTEKHKM